MSRKTLVYIGSFVGSVLGGLVPTLWKADFFSFSSLIAGSVGAIVGIIIALKLTPTTY